MGKTVQLAIPNACRQDWHNMTPVEQGRHCDNCCKTVVDFSNMSDREILHHIAKAGGSGVCGRLHPGQLHRKIPVQQESRWPWLKYFFQCTLPAFLISMKAEAKTELRIAPDTMFVEKKYPGYKEVDEDKVTIKGRVMDKEGTGVPAASVIIKGQSARATTDMEGNFNIYTDKISLCQ